MNTRKKEEMQRLRKIFKMMKKSEEDFSHD